MLNAINFTGYVSIINKISGRLDMALVIKIGRLMDSGVVEIDNRLPV